MEPDPQAPRPDNPDTAPVVLPAGRLEGRELFRQAVRDALASAAAQGWHEIMLSDASFEDWPLGEQAVVASLHAWARHGRRMTLLARRYDDIPLRHPRFVQWRQTWSHRIDCHGCRHADALEIPSAIWSPGWYLQRLDVEHCTTVCGEDPQRRALLRNTLDEWLRRSAPAFPATTLGL
ncbi:MAG: hypothetical protein Q8K38_04705 [Burkholderiaceae bacterium]|nr:hypothetical protein [Burkholderiaceae bacterium]MDZ4146469.1 hypothetical protein [Burkholderiales bacterium]